MSTDQLAADLASLSKQAKRCQHIVHRFDGDDLTEWDAKHRAIDLLLDRYRKAQAVAAEKAPA